MARVSQSPPARRQTKLLVERSRDPECDAARALVAKGISGELTLLDGKTGIPRTIINIERAAKLTAEEGPGAPLLQKLPREVWQRRLQPRNGFGCYHARWKRGQGCMIKVDETKQSDSSM